MTRIRLWLIPMLACLCLSIITTEKPTAAELSPEDLTTPSSWKADQFKTNALVGKLWSRAEGKFVTPGEMLADLKTAKFIHLGELHDNPDHHTLQANIITALAKTAKAANKPVPAIVIEMIRVDQMRRLNAYLETDNPKAEFLGNALEWEQNGWPSWEIYRPLGEAIFANDMEIYPGHASRMQINHLIKSDLAILPAKARETFGLNTPLGKTLEDSLSEEIRVAHCDRLPENVIKPMTIVQRFRDAWMADVLIQAGETDDEKPRQSILIAGRGHTRDDRGAPWYLRNRVAAAKTKTVHFIETNATAATISDLLKAELKNQDLKTIPADYIWVTPSIKRGDPCENIPDFGKKD
ncbi:MAG: hypothetical protein DHS20C08_06870 [Rhodomicrobium sp.]|nr:MAG: hypothetical protein DHS20C08_06870 [Rhodomicrobium sp.]